MTNDTLTRVARIIDPSAFEEADQFPRDSWPFRGLWKVDAAMDIAQDLLSEGLIKEELGGSCGADGAVRDAQGAPSAGALEALNYAARSIDALGGTYSPEQHASGYARAHMAALDAAYNAVVALGAKPS